MRDGATNRFSSGDGMMTSWSGTAGSATASYTLRDTCGMSRNDIVLLACGSRSMSSVRLPRRARAAARLIAVVVLPTPPFWLAIATIMVGMGTSEQNCNRIRAGVELNRSGKYSKGRCPDGGHAYIL